MGGMSAEYKKLNWIIPTYTCKLKKIILKMHDNGDK
jgi:hypothetical protein